MQNYGVTRKKWQKLTKTKNAFKSLTKHHYPISIFILKKEKFSDQIKKSLQSQDYSQSL